jgi:hypothetical protein
MGEKRKICLMQHQRLPYQGEQSSPELTSWVLKLKGRIESPTNAGWKAASSLFWQIDAGPIFRIRFIIRH